MMAGGGLDIKLSKHIAFRPIGADYYLTRVPSFLTGNTTNRNNFRYSAGINFLFGGEKPAPAPAAPRHQEPARTEPPCRFDAHRARSTTSRSASPRTPREVCPGETAQVTAIDQRARTAIQLNYTWIRQRTTGRPGAIARIRNRRQGRRAPTTIALHVQRRRTSTRPPPLRPSWLGRTSRPRERAQANPAQIYAGEKSTLSASFQGQCGGPIQAPTFRGVRRLGARRSVRLHRQCSSILRINAEQRKTVTITAKRRRQPERRNGNHQHRCGQEGRDRSDTAA